MHGGRFSIGDIDEPRGDAADIDGWSAGAPVDRWDWLAGFLLAIVIMGPGLGPGPLLNLDLLVTPEVPVPNGIFGLGPSLSQRVPMFAVFGVGSWFLGGPLTMKLFFLLGLTTGFVGMARLARPAGGRMGAFVAGVLWVAGPFLVTRLAVGHVQFVWFVALFPWVTTTLIRPSRRLDLTFLAMMGFAFGGPATGTLALVVVAVGLAVERQRRVPAVLFVCGAASLLWVGPTAVLLWAGAQVAGAGRFATSASGVDGWLSLLGGGGFWSPARQIGGSGWVMAVGSVVLVALGMFGHRRLPSWGRPLAAVGGVGLVLTAASAVPGVRRIYDQVSGMPIGAPLRESQRFLVLWLAWLAPAVGAGSARLGAWLAARGGDNAGGFDAVGRTIPLVVVGAISVGGWWGMHGVFAPVTYPDGWAAARSLVRSEPGTTVALPWNQYPPLHFIDGRNAFNPLPDYLGGDVISSFDPLFDRSNPGQEQVDRRAWFLDGPLRGVGPLGDAMSEVGARWVVLVHQPGWESFDLRLGQEPDAFEVALDTPEVTVWRVRSWSAPVVDRNGVGYGQKRPIPMIVHADAPEGSVLSVAGAPGWVQGWFRPVPSNEAGRLVLPAGGSGPLWFWPAVPLLMCDVVLGGSALMVARRARRRTDPLTSHNGLSASR